MNDSIVIHMNIIILCISSSWYIPLKSFFKTSEFQSFYLRIYLCVRYIILNQGQKDKDAAKAG